MANTLTGLIPTIYEALDIVSRELVGFIPSASIDASADRVAKDQTLRVPIVPTVTASAVSPGLYAPDSGDQTISYVDMSISKSYMVPVRWTGIEQKGLMSSGTYSRVMLDRFAQAFRTLANTIEYDLYVAAYQGASRAYGTAGSNPFASDMSATAQVRKILDDNGAPQEGRSLVINTTAGAALRSLASLASVSLAGTDQTLRRGALLDLNNFMIRESGQIGTHTKGTGAGMDCTAIEPINETTIAVDGNSGSGTILIGDIITRGNEGSSAADANKYVVYSSTCSGATSGNIVINGPGLKVATAVNDEWTIGNSYTPNVAFQRQALQLLARIPERPIEGDMADDVTIVTDPISGLSFEVSMYKQYRQVHYEVAISWGVAAIKSAHIAILLG